MAVREIILYPDTRLSTAARPVESFDSTLENWIADLVETMTYTRAAGLAGPHVGISKRIVVIRMALVDSVRVFINPTIVWSSETMATHQEGSVSLPGLTADVERAARVRVQYFDPDGSERIVEADGFFSACLQHEIDQLDGIFWLARLSRLKRERLIAKASKSSRGLRG